jgi:hypothetical protein
MTDRERHQRIVEQIATRYGRVIDLDKSPLVMIEILRTFGRALDTDGGGGSGGGGGVSTIAVGITPPQGGDENVGIADLVQVVLRLQREVGHMRAQLEHLAGPGGTRTR